MLRSDRKQETLEHRTDLIPQIFYGNEIVFYSLVPYAIRTHLEEWMWARGEVTFVVPYPLPYSERNMTTKSVEKGF